MNLIFGTFLLTLLFSTRFIDARLHACKASGKVKGKKPPPDYCHENSDTDSCCTVGKYYDTYKCSPSVSGSTKGVLNPSRPDVITSTIQTIRQLLLSRLDGTVEGAGA
ncbi:hypothetical protein ACS0TY_019867 [Phlomoides rotata]